MQTPAIKGILDGLAPIRSFGFSTKVRDLVLLKQFAETLAGMLLGEQRKSVRIDLTFKLEPNLAQRCWKIAQLIQKRPPRLGVQRGVMEAFRFLQRVFSITRIPLSW